MTSKPSGGNDDEDARQNGSSSPPRRVAGAHISHAYSAASIAQELGGVTVLVSRAAMDGIVAMDRSALDSQTVASAAGVEALAR